MSTNRRSQGNQFEKLAANYLVEKGLTIIETNFYSKMGEVDIICKDNEYLCFVEVKYRKNASAGSALEAVNFNKMRKICRAADYYLMTHPKFANSSIRFDVIAIENGHLEYVINAFEYIQY